MKYWIIRMQLLSTLNWSCIEVERCDLGLLKRRDIGRNCVVQAWSQFSTEDATLITGFVFKCLDRWNLMIHVYKESAWDTIDVHPIVHLGRWISTKFVNASATFIHSSILLHTIGYRPPGSNVWSVASWRDITRAILLFVLKRRESATQ